jgi:hypothetical protein
MTSRLSTDIYLLTAILKPFSELVLLFYLDGASVLLIKHTFFRDDSRLRISSFFALFSSTSRVVELYRTPKRSGETL